MNFYSSSEYCSLQTAYGLQIHQFDIEVEPNKKSKIFGLCDGEVALYGTRAPFWYPWKPVEDIELSTAEQFVLQFIQQNQLAGMKQVRLRLPPRHYSKTIPLLEFQLRRNSFKEHGQALWQYINVSEFDNSEHYTSNLKKTSQKILKKYVGEDVKLEELDPERWDDIEAAYNLINENRKSLGVQLKYSSSHLLLLNKVFKGYIKVFNLCITGKPVASAICHMTAADVMYVAAWGDHGHTLKYSPMYPFAALLVDYVKKNKIKTLDFGTSSDLELYTPTLYLFKKNIGCQLEIQRTFILNFS
jgi:hypothetical protein